MRSLILLLFSCLFLSCSNEVGYKTIIVDGKKVIRNRVNKNVNTVKAETKKLYELNLGDLDLAGFFPHYIDDKGNLYLSSYKEGKIAIIDKYGKLSKIFGGNGEGPGEIIQPNGIILNGDTIFVISVNSRIVNKYDLNGNFINRKSLGKPIAESIGSVNGNCYSGILKNYSRDSKGNFIEYNIALFDMNFENINKIGSSLKTRFTKKDNLLKMYPIYTSSTLKEEVAIALLSDNEYEIDIYDKEGKLKYKIQRNYLVTPLTDIERNKCYSYFKSMIKRLEISDIKSLNNLAIKKVFYDKFGNLLVASSSRDKNEKLILDCYKDGIFQKKINFNEILDLPLSVESRYLDFKGNYIVDYDYSNSFMSVYEYNY